ncbi:hypothetical protein [Mycobacterium asiaticum]|uniref:Secreted protein n=1 Tax=Mycobacterium asiaticum TaxID=1790 RepID=A0A1A3MWP4_MYCAS|nr:hypothetical protein [Mycobacterium asiaticum]OBK12582.1 hypothetical protein A5636_11215 [Mycobacterium asiaticum]
MGKKTVVAAVALSFAALFSARLPSAAAEVPEMQGVYAYTESDGVAATWTITTTCAPGCVAHVTTSPGHGFNAPLVNGRHTVTRSVPDGVTCPAYLLGDNGSLWSGGTWPVTVRQWWDPVSLNGGVEFLDSPSPCGIPNPRTSFTLTPID